MKCGPSKKEKKRREKGSAVRLCARAQCQERPCELQKRSEAEGWKVQADSPRCHLHTQRMHGAPARERVKERRDGRKTDRDEQTV